MGNNRDHREMIDLLDATLDTFGADVSRWPETVRSPLVDFVAADAVAKARMAEARALDRVLALAPGLDESRQRVLAEQIAGKAQRQPRMVAGAQADASPPHAPARSGFQRLPLRRSPLQRNSWVAGTLAASLMLGVLAGRLPIVDSVADTMLGDDVQTQQVVAQGLDVDSLWDEDLL